MVNIQNPGSPILKSLTFLAKYRIFSVMGNIDKMGEILVKIRYNNGEENCPKTTDKTNKDTC